MTLDGKGVPLVLRNGFVVGPAWRGLDTPADPSTPRIEISDESGQGIPFDGLMTPDGRHAVALFPVFSPIESGRSAATAAPPTRTTSCRTASRRRSPG